MKPLFLARESGSAVRPSLSVERAYSMCPDSTIPQYSYAPGHSILDLIIDIIIRGSLFWNDHLLIVIVLVYIL